GGAGGAALRGARRVRADQRHRSGARGARGAGPDGVPRGRSEEHTSELQSRFDLVCRLLLEKKIFHPLILRSHIMIIKYSIFAYTLIFNYSLCLFFFLLPSFFSIFYSSRILRYLLSFPTRRSSDLGGAGGAALRGARRVRADQRHRSGARGARGAGPDGVPRGRRALPAEHGGSGRRQAGP